MAISEVDYNLLGMGMASIRKVIVKSFMGALKRGRRPRSIMIWGAPGTGKTFTVYAAGEDIGKALSTPKNKVECEVLAQLTSCLEPVDVTGIPTPITEGGDTVFTRYLAPEWAWRASKEYEAFEQKKDPKFKAPPMVLFFDDLPAAHFQTQTAFFKGVHEGMWGHLLQRDNVMVVAAGNRVEDNAAANDMPTPLANRFTHLYANPTTDDWLAWASDTKQGDVHPYVIGYIRQNKGNLNEFNEEVANRDEKPFASSRSWEEVSNLMWEGEISHEDEDIFPKTIMGQVGRGIGTEYLAYLRHTNAVVPPEEICKDPKKARIPSARNLDALHATIASLEHHIKHHPTLWKKGIEYALRKEMVTDFGILLARTCIRVMETLPSEIRAKECSSELMVRFYDRYDEALESIVNY